MPKSGFDRNKLITQLQAIAAANPLTQSIQDILIHKSFPVDIRHNSKIFREKLRLWATEKLLGKSKATAAKKS